MDSTSQPLRRRHIKKAPQNPRNVIDHVLRENATTFHPADRVWSLQEIGVKCESCREPNEIENVQRAPDGSPLEAGPEECFLATEWRLCVRSSSPVVSGQAVNLLVCYAGCAYGKSAILQQAPPKWNHFRCRVFRLNERFEAASLAVELSEYTEIADRLNMKPSGVGVNLQFAGVWYPAFTGRYMIDIGIQGSISKGHKSHDLDSAYHSIDGSPAYIRVSAGFIAASQSYIQPLSREDLESNSLFGTLTVVLRDKAGNPVTDGKEIPTVVPIGAVNILRLTREKDHALISYKISDRHPTVPCQIQVLISDENLTQGSPATLRDWHDSGSIGGQTRPSVEFITCLAQKQCVLLKIGPTFPPFLWSVSSESPPWWTQGWLGNLRQLTVPYALSPLEHCMQLMREYCRHIISCPMTQTAVAKHLSAGDYVHKMNLKITGRIHQAKKAIADLTPIVDQDVEHWNSMRDEFREISQQLVLGVLKDMPITITGIVDMEKDIEVRQKRRETCKKIHKEHIARLQKLNKRQQMFQESRKLVIAKLGEEITRRVELNSNHYKLIARHNWVVDSVNKQTMIWSGARKKVITDLKQNEKYRSAAISWRTAKAIKRELYELDIGKKPEELASFGSLVRTEEDDILVSGKIVHAGDTEKAVNRIIDRFKMRAGAHRDTAWNAPPPSDTLAYDFMAASFWRRRDQIDALEKATVPHLRPVVSNEVTRWTEYVKPSRTGWLQRPKLTRYRHAWGLDETVLQGPPVKAPKQEKPMPKKPSIAEPWPVLSLPQAWVMPMGAPPQPENYRRIRVDWEKIYGSRYRPMDLPLDDEEKQAYQAPQLVPSIVPKKADLSAVGVSDMKILANVPGSEKLPAFLGGLPLQDSLEKSPAFFVMKEPQKAKDVGK